MEQFLMNLDNKNIWMNPIPKPHISPFQENDINTIATLLLETIGCSIRNAANRIIQMEFDKRPRATLEQKILIRKQIINNISENITNLTLTVAKERYETINQPKEFPKQLESEKEPVFVDYYYDYQPEYIYFHNNLDYQFGQPMDVDISSNESLFQHQSLDEFLEVS